VRDKAAFQRGVRWLQGQGHAVEIDPAALTCHQRFAGDDAARLAAIARAAASGADVALISRGGYGLTRLLDALPYRAIAKAAERGTHFVGFSDFTALQLAVYTRTGTRTWAGPTLGADFGAAAGPDEITQACFDDLLGGQGEGTGWRIAARDAQWSEGFPARAIHGATLWGGNLSVLVSLLGTPYFPQPAQIDRGVLFLEDVNEHPYRIERMFDQLRHAGLLARQRGILLGSFAGCDALAHDRGFSMRTVIARLRGLIRAPVLTGLPLGHTPRKVLLPVGARVDVTLDERDVLVLWGHP
jgi:muramoyltetrapeptide carboxypeptidase